ncbi:hypothetical protein [Burkholderia sp. Ax-1719]|uniref:plasmid mobilization protein n=1 Tax=Burkholderia sp. Ax-1719 TaxID=2608334 RepID=UPI00141E0EC3|nr:hypothetical protein [Burkholderia sp. Ax-1719]NIE63754.1 hypothetical protein [Burkholderia sp. Ax-1719]
MNKPSERIVVFVTPAQKRAISATADELGISVSELMRRAVIAFSATSDQVKAASIVDRLNAPREPDALAQVLRKAAKPLRVGRGAGFRPSAQAQPQAQEEPAADDDAPQEAPAQNHAERELAQTVARLAAEAHAAESAESEADVENSHSDTVHLREVPPVQSLSNAPFARTQRVHDEADDPDSDAAPEGGRFA